MSRLPSRDRGYVFITMREQASTMLRLEDWGPLNRAIDLDLIWFLGTDLHGDQERIRIADIMSLNRSTPEGLDRQQEEEEQAGLEGNGAV